MSTVCAVIWLVFGIASLRIGRLIPHFLSNRMDLVLSGYQSEYLHTCEPEQLMDLPDY